MRRYEDVVENQQGTPVAGVSVQVNIAGTSAPAQLFSDDGITPLLNPVKTDSLGRFSFWIATGKYDLIASGGGISVIYTQQNVSIDELTDPNPLDLPWATEQLMFVPQTVSPNTPPGGSVVYSKQVDNNLYYKNAAGQEIGPLGQSGVISVNGGTGAVVVQAGTNVTVTTVGNVITISATGGGGGGSGVTSLNGLTGAISLIQGSNMSIAQVGNNLVLSAAASTSNLYVDVTSFGAKPVLPFSPPNAQASCTAGSTTITLNTPSQFTNGEGVAFYDCGPACTLATPGAPTIVPSYAATLTGVADVVNAPAGTATFNYQVMARQTNGAFTAAGPVGSTSTANPLGRIETNVSTLSRSGNVVTVQMAAAQQMVVGQTVFMHGSSDASFTGVYLVSSVSNAFTFSYLQGLTTVNGASTSATGGVAVVFSCNFVSWAPVSGAFQYYVYGAPSGSGLSLIGVTAPGVTTFEDYGPAFNPTVTRPLYIPASPPLASAPGILSTTIVSGGGTTTLQVANAASSSTTNVYCQHDDAPCILAAANFVVSANGRNTLHFPVASGPGGNHFNSAYLISSYLVLPFGVQGVVQSMSIWLSDTMQLPGNLTWQGDIGGAFSSAPAFSWNTAIPIFGNGANPCIWQDPSAIGANRWDNIAFSNFSSNGLIFVLGNNGALFNTSFVDCSFVLSGSNDHMGTAIMTFGMSQLHLQNVLFSANDQPPLGYSLTPLLHMRPDIPMVNGTGNVVMERVFLVGRGLFAKAPNVGGRQQFIMENCYAQQLQTPYLTLGQMNEAHVTIHSLTNDTGITPFLCNLNPFLFIAPDVLLMGQMQIAAEGGTGFSSLLSGNPAAFVTAWGLDTTPQDSPIGQNFNTIFGRAGQFTVLAPASLSSVQTNALQINSVLFASLGASANGTFLYCSDCTVTSPCAGAGTGALAKRLNGTWVCN